MENALVPELLRGRVFSFLIGYFLGCILTGEITARVLTGKSASEIGRSGNPGMANIMENLGFVPGICTLAGDLLKCIAAVFLARRWFSGSIGDAAALYAAAGCIVGHDYPFWRKFNGGKGVASSCIGFFLIEPLSGAVSVLSGLAVVLFTKYLCLGGAAIPVVFTLLLVLEGHMEKAAVIGLIAVISVTKHSDILLIPGGTCPKTDVPAAIRKKFGRKNVQK